MDVKFWKSNKWIEIKDYSHSDFEKFLENMGSNSTDEMENS